MILVRRLALVVSIVFCGSLAMAAAVVAAGGGGGGLGPGVYTFTNKDASATFGTLKGGQPGQQGFSVFVDQGLNAFRPRDPKGPRTIMNSTIVSLVLFDDAGNSTFGCFLIKASDFTVSKNLQTARVHTTLTADEVCPGFGAPVTGQSGVAAAPVPFAGGGGGGTDLPLPISLDVTWTGLGVTSTGTDRNTSQCLNYNTVFTSSFRSSNANASGTMSAIGGSFDTSSAVVSSSDSHGTVKGTLQPACFPQ
jgi:hypothetical protein